MAAGCPPPLPIHQPVPTAAATTTAPPRASQASFFIPLTDHPYFLLRPISYCARARPGKTTRRPRPMRIRSVP
ncbi:hypothetical protein L565_1220 [Bordetella pertussis CHLA-20]|nr:hypothetical protein L565_1220 [Bordetella pertussis CHLA-20]